MLSAKFSNTKAAFSLFQNRQDFRFGISARFHKHLLVHKAQENSTDKRSYFPGGLPFQSDRTPSTNWRLRAGLKVFLLGHPATWPCRVTGPQRSASAWRCSAKNDSPDHFYGLTPRAGAIASSRTASNRHSASALTNGAPPHLLRQL